MMYSHLIRPILFQLDPERAHELTMSMMANLSRSAAGRSMLGLYSGRIPSKPVKAMGLEFPHPVGLAAGLDKHAQAVDGFLKLGFSHVEVGTLTPRPQDGNPKPRLFRIPQDQALINRMGFNNCGAEDAAKRLAKRRVEGIVGGNIGKNKVTPNELAAEDYIAALEALEPYVDYFTINVSSPNTPGLRDLQHEDALKDLLTRIEQANAGRKPLAVKMAPDMDRVQAETMSKLAVDCGFQGIIATNTTISRDHLTVTDQRIEDIGAGGLSGRPLTKRSTEVIEWVRQAVGDQANVIGVGGIFTADDVRDKLNAGADLVQVYSGFIYHGPRMVQSLASAW